VPTTSAMCLGTSAAMVEQPLKQSIGRSLARWSPNGRDKGAHEPHATSANATF
jgi:hypothetical protein